jgi:bifunctional non-homologous end joining protein LigD
MDETVGGPPRKLTTYRHKRDFAETPEPSGDPRGPEPVSGMAQSQFRRFVVQEHHARSLHWDFRLERDGVLQSWAVPKGPPLEPGIKRLAVATEDHPLDYLEFEGTIPPGNYGAGTVSIWDRGMYAIASETRGKMLLALMGGRLQGAYYLVHTRENQWLMWKLDESKGQPER